MLNMRFYQIVGYSNLLHYITEIFDTIIIGNFLSKKVEYE